MKMYINSGTSLLLMLFCFAKPYHCLADTCTVRNTFLRTCPKFDIGDSAKNIRTVLFEQQSVERESRMVNVREKVGSERLVNNRRIVDSDSRISNFPAKSANNDRIETIPNRDFRRSVFINRVASTNPNEFRVRESNRDLNNRRYLTRESRIADSREGRRSVLPINDGRTSERFSRDREARIVNDRDASRIIRELDTDMTRDSRELTRKTRSVEEESRTIDRSVSSTRNVRARELSLKDEDKKTVDRTSHSSNHRSPIRSRIDVSSTRRERNEQRTTELPIQKRSVDSNGLRISNSQPRNFVRTRVIRETGDRRLKSKFQSTRNERQNSRTSDSTEQTFQRIAENSNQDARRFGRVRLIDAQQDFRVRDLSRNVRTSDDRLNKDRIITAERVRINERTSRADAFLKRDSRSREQRLNVRENDDTYRTVEERTSSADAFLERDSRILVEPSNTRAPRDSRRTINERTSRLSRNGPSLERYSRVRVERSRESDIRAFNENRNTIEDRTSRATRRDAILDQNFRIRVQRSAEPNTRARNSNIQRTIEERASRFSLGDAALERDGRSNIRVLAETSDRRISRLSRDDASLQRDSRIRVQRSDEPNMRENFDNRRTIDERTSRVKQILDRDSRIRVERSNMRAVRENSDDRRTIEERTRRTRGAADLNRDSRIRVQRSAESNMRLLRANSESREERTRRISSNPMTSERRVELHKGRITEPSADMRISRNSNNFRIDERRAVRQNIDARMDRSATDDRVSNIRFSVSDLSTKDENNNERIQASERRFIPEMMLKKTNYTTWSNIVTTTLSVLLFAHMIGTSLELKKYQYFPSCFNAVKEKMF